MLLSEEIVVILEAPSKMTAQRAIWGKNAIFLGKFHDNKIWISWEFIVRNFVVIWEAPMNQARSRKLKLNFRVWISSGGWGGGLYVKG